MFWKERAQETPPTPDIAAVRFGKNSKGRDVVSFPNAKHYTEDGLAVGRHGYDLQNAANEDAVKTGDLLEVARIVRRKRGETVQESMETTVFRYQAPHRTSILRGGIGAQGFFSVGNGISDMVVIEAKDIVAWSTVSIGVSITEPLGDGKTTPKEPSLQSVQPR